MLQLDELLADGADGVKYVESFWRERSGCQIVEHAYETKVDLIMMPTHGYGPFRRFLLVWSRESCTTPTARC